MIFFPFLQPDAGANRDQLLPKQAPTGRWWVVGCGRRRRRGAARLAAYKVFSEFVPDQGQMADYVRSGGLLARQIGPVMPPDCGAEDDF